MLCFFGVVNPRTISLFVLSEKVQKQPAHSAKQKFFVKLLYTKVCGFPKGKALGAHRSVRNLVQKKKASSSKLPLFCIG